MPAKVPEYCSLRPTKGLGKLVSIEALGHFRGHSDLRALRSPQKRGSISMFHKSSEASQCPRRACECPLPISVGADPLSTKVRQQPRGHKWRKSFPATKTNRRPYSSTAAVRVTNSSLASSVSARAALLSKEAVEYFCCRQNKIQQRGCALKCRGFLRSQEWY
jgi:hypothetical protein